MWTMILIWLCMFLPMFFWGGCPCCGDFCEGCSTGLSECWEVTIAGITDNSCTLCDNFNRTWTLVPHETLECRRENDDRTIPAERSVFGSCNSGFAGVFFQPSGSGRWILRIGWDENGDGVLVGFADYFLDAVDLDCDGELTFGELTTGDTSCQNFPATVTATAITCP